MDKGSYDTQFKFEKKEFEEVKNLIALVFCCLNFKNENLKLKNFEEILKDDRDAEERRIIKNFHKIDEKYYRGAAPDSRGIEYLIEYKKVRTIIDLRNLSRKDFEKQEAFVNGSGLNYINIPMNPMFPPGIKQINRFLNIVNSDNNYPVYVHCREGKDRTGIMTAIYRVKHYNYNFDKAFVEMMKFGHHVNLFPLLKVWLYNYIAGIQQKMSNPV